MIFTRKDKIQTQVAASRRELMPRPVIYASMPLSSRQSVPKSVTVEVKPEKKMVWGEPTWYLFHTMAEKVKPEAFAQLRMEILGVINTICGLLPCPICANHARDYMSKLNFNAIQTKEQFKLMLWQFHNTVNARKGYPEFTEAMLNEKYSRANLINIFGKFMYHFQDRPLAGFKQINDSFHRSRAAKHIREWFTANMNAFDLSGMLPTDVVV